MIGPIGSLSSSTTVGSWSRWWPPPHGPAAGQRHGRRDDARGSGRPADHPGADGARSCSPMGSLTAVARAVVAVVYEAYAVNLRRARRCPTSVTRYTDYPFNQIVRFKGRYLGVADDGLYELGGDTDYDATTPANPAWSGTPARRTSTAAAEERARPSSRAGWPQGHRLGVGARGGRSGPHRHDRGGTAAQNHRIIRARPEGALLVLRLVRPGRRRVKPTSFNRTQQNLEGNCDGRRKHPD